MTQARYSTPVNWVQYVFDFPPKDCILKEVIGESSFSPNWGELSGEPAMKASPIGSAAALALASISLTAWAAPAKKPGGARAAAVPAAPATPAPEGGAKVDAQRIWPANLERIAGRYTFSQVASPGGLWERGAGPDGVEVRRQVSINEVPAAFRDKLLNAEVVISDLKSPRRVEASERLSPSKRGMLRFYEEEGLGSVVVRNIPGINGQDEEHDYSGPVIFHLQHQSHSNPSVNGVLQQRGNEEATWGAATLDSATLTANTIPKDEKDEGDSIITNARILRSGVEIFAFVEWTEKDETSRRLINGSIRLVRRVEDMPRKDAVPSGETK